MMTLDFRLLRSVGIAGLVLVAGCLAGISCSDLIRRSFRLTPSSDESAPASSGIAVNQPRGVTSVNDGQDRDVYIAIWPLSPAGPYVGWARYKTRE